MAAIVCIALSLAAIECSLLSSRRDQLYNPVSLATVVLAACLMAAIAIASGWIAATGFTLTYTSFSLGLIWLNASLYSLETLFVPLLTSIMLLGELVLLVFPAQVLLRWIAFS
ncbi:MAG: hypothetical protein HC824_18260 [Synechococcales cyanobacterium RM1_1_8]|nr:hypothetical protein [Synechococcales cyanobacterium RM1_1_8]